MTKNKTLRITHLRYWIMLTALILLNTEHALALPPSHKATNKTFERLTAISKKAQLNFSMNTDGQWSTFISLWNLWVGTHGIKSPFNLKGIKGKGIGFRIPYSSKVNTGFYGAYLYLHDLRYHNRQVLNRTGANNVVQSGIEYDHAVGKITLSAYGLKESNSSSYIAYSGFMDYTFQRFTHSSSYNINLHLMAYALQRFTPWCRFTPFGFITATQHKFKGTQTSFTKPFSPPVPLYLISGGVGVSCELPYYLTIEPAFTWSQVTTYSWSIKINFRSSVERTTQKNWRQHSFRSMPHINQEISNCYSEFGNAVRNNDSKKAETYLRAGIDPETLILSDYTKTAQGFTQCKYESPIHIASRQNCLDMVRLLLHYKASSFSNEHCRTTNGDEYKSFFIDFSTATPLLTAALKGHYAVVRLLLQQNNATILSNHPTDLESYTFSDDYTTRQGQIKSLRYLYEGGDTNAMFLYANRWTKMGGSLAEYAQYAQQREEFSSALVKHLRPTNIVGWHALNCIFIKRGFLISNSLNAYVPIRKNLLQLLDDLQENFIQKIRTELLPKPSDKKHELSSRFTQFPFDKHTCRNETEKNAYHKNIISFLCEYQRKKSTIIKKIVSTRPGLEREQTKNLISLVEKIWIVQGIFFPLPKEIVDLIDIPSVIDSITKDGLIANLSCENHNIFMPESSCIYAIEKYLRGDLLDFSEESDLPEFLSRRFGTQWDRESNNTVYTA